MTILQPQQLTLNPEDNFILTNNSEPYECMGDLCPSSEHLMDKNRVPGHCTHASEDLHYTYARRPYTIRVGESKQVPFDIVRLYFGDPRSVPDEFLRYEDYDGQKGDIPPRQQEVKRIAGLYGLYDQNKSLLPTHPRIAGVTIVSIATPTAPSLEIFTPAIDPEGDVGIYGHRKPDEQSNDIATLLADQRAQMAALQSRIDQLETLRTDPINGEDESISKDGPRGI